MKRTILFAILMSACLSVPALALTPAHRWSERHGDAADQNGASLAADPAGNVYVAGYFQGEIDLGGGPLTSAGSTDVFLAKFSADGTHMWSKRFGMRPNRKARPWRPTPKATCSLPGPSSAPSIAVEA